MRDLNEVLDLTLHLPIGGKTYTVQPPPANIAADLLNRLAFGIAADAGIELDDEARGLLLVSDDDMPDFATQCLGPVHQQLLDDNVPGPQIEFCVITAFYAWTVGKEFAELFWETGGKAMRPADQSRDRRPTATPTRAAAASTTPTSASASGTRTPLGLSAQA